MADRIRESGTGRYAGTLATAIAALVPFLVLSTAEPLFRSQLARPLHTSDTSMAVASGLSLAAYAFGAMLAGDLAQRFRQRRLFLICETGFVGAWAASAAVGAALKTRWLAPLTGLGLASLIAGGWLLLDVVAGRSSPGPGAFLLGIAAGAPVAPGLWLASLSLQSSLVGRTVAVVELVRSEADFIAAPVLLKIGPRRRCRVIDGRWRVARDRSDDRDHRGPERRMHRFVSCGRTRATAPAPGRLAERKTAGIRVAAAGRYGPRRRERRGLI